MGLGIGLYGWPVCLTVMVFGLRSLVFGLCSLGFGFWLVVFGFESLFSPSCLLLLPTAPTYRCSRAMQPDAKLIIDRDQFGAPV